MTRGMADDTTDTTPGDAPGVLMTGSDGSLPDGLGGSRAWVWMQDTQDGGGGRFDVLVSRVDVWRRKGATVVPNYPIHHGPSGRTAKPAANLAGRSAGEPEASPTDPAADTTGERQADPAPSPADGDNTDQADGNTAAADTTTTTRTKGGRTR